MRDRFDRYVERCLYDPEHGFYSSGEGAAGGRAGDFVTSPEIGPLFADVLARALDAWWEELDRPDPYRIFDVGSGPGTLTRMLTRAGGTSAAARRVEAVDRAGPSATGPGLPDDLDGAVVLANELLDNLPFRIVERTGAGWVEIHVEHDGDGAAGRPVEVHAPIEDRAADRALAVLDRLDGVAAGTRVPILEAASTFVDDLLARGAALVLAFDYGAPTTAELAVRGGWLRTYRRHQRGEDPYREPGWWDITTDIALDQLPPAADVTDQAAFLRRWGIDDLVEEGRAHWRANAAAPTVAALRMRSRVTEAEALLDPDGLGSWLAVRWGST